MRTKYNRIEQLTVNPRGSIGSFSVLPSVFVIKLSRHSAQKSSLSNQLEPLLPYYTAGNAQLLPILLLLLLGQPILGLRDFKLAVALEVDKADSEVGSSQVEGEVFADFLAGRPLLDQPRAGLAFAKANVRQRRMWELLRQL